ncbi:MAG: hypothetical protein Q8O61_07690 [Nocardioides sp.]|nr:hypothetical protein [Nocardioides sp.]
MSTPTDGPGGQPNPYGAPSGQPANPYGATPPAQPTGGGGYGGSYPGGPPVEQPQSKGLAIAALVLAFVPCLQIISLILAIIVLVKKKAGKGLAIAALIIDVLALIGIVIAVAVGGLWISNNVITVDNAETGQCVNTTTEDDSVALLKKDCSEAHDAEVIVVGDLTADELATYESDVAAVCETRLAEDGGDPAELQGDSWQLLTEEIPPGEGDAFVCLIENSDGSKLDGK